MTDHAVAIIIAVIGSGLFNSILNIFLESKKGKKNEYSDLRKAVQLITRSRIRYLCNVYIRQGWIYSDELQDLIEMHKCYHDDLKGNGYLDEIMERTKDLEIRTHNYKGGEVSHVKSE